LNAANRQLSGSLSEPGQQGQVPGDDSHRSTYLPSSIRDFESSERRTLGQGGPSREPGRDLEMQMRASRRARFENRLSNEMLMADNRRIRLEQPLGNETWHQVRP
jgi:hypothetical protein